MTQRKPPNYVEVLGGVFWDMNDPSPDLSHLTEGRRYRLDDKVYTLGRDNRLFEVDGKGQLFFCEWPLTGWLYEDVEVGPNYVETRLTKYTVADLVVADEFTTKGD